MPRRTSAGGYRRFFFRTSYVLRLLILAVAIGAIGWIFGADVYVVGVLVLSAGVIFAGRIAPGLIPALVRWVGLVPYLLGLLIPLWNILSAVFNGNLIALRDGGISLGVYLLALLVIWWLPTTMGRPFERWLPPDAAPERRGRRGRAVAASQATSASGYASSGYTSSGYNRSGYSSSGYGSGYSSSGYGSSGYGSASSRAFYADDEDDGAPASGKTSGEGQQRRGLFGRKKEAQPAASTASRANYYADEDEAPAKQRRGLFGRKKAAQPAASTASRASYYADEDEAPAKQRRGLFGRKKEAQPAASSTSYPRYYADEDEAPAKQRRGLFGRKKEAESVISQPSFGSAFYANEDEYSADARQSSGGKRRGLFGRGGKAQPAVSKSVASGALSAFYEDDEDEGPAQKKRGLFRRGEKAQPAASTPSRASTHRPDSGTSPAEKRRGPFGRGGKAQPATGKSVASGGLSAFYEDDEAPAGQKKHGLFRRGGKDKAQPAATGPARTTGALNAFYAEREEEAPEPKKRGLFRRGDQDKPATGPAARQARVIFSSDQRREEPAPVHKVTTSPPRQVSAFYMDDVDDMLDDVPDDADDIDDILGAYRQRFQRDDGDS